MAIIILFLLLLFQPALQSQEFFYNGFKHVGQNLTLNGAAEIEHSGVLRLTRGTPRLIGHAFRSNPFLFKNLSTGKMRSFSCAFAFSMAPQIASLGGHGMAFVVSRAKDIPGAFSRQYLGLVNTTDNGNSSNHIFAVEFDTVQDIEFGDINDNHVGIDINSLVSNASANAAYFRDGNTSAKHDLNLKSGKTIQAWVDYDGTRNELNVTLSLTSAKPNRSILSFPVDLAPLFEDYMYVGFSASTGLLASSHYVYGWSFKMDSGEAQPLDLASLPSLPRPRKKHSVLILVVSVSGLTLVVFVFLIARYFYMKMKNRERIEDWEMDVGPHRYSYAELKQATKGFRDKELLGFGGFGRVYKGVLPVSNVEVAVKKIGHESTQGLSEFVSEIATIGRLRHRNLVQLLGWCRRGSDLLLVYDFMPNGSLDKWLFHQPENILSWKQRFKIVRGVASGLLYLHEEWEQTVIHRDVKAGNILLDDDLNGRLGDFGLAKLYEHGSDPSTTRVVGTLGYLAPELTKTGKPTTASDVFAFGALLMEVVCGRRPIEQKALPEELILIDWVWDRWKQGLILDVVDPRLGHQFDEVEVITVLKLALMCSYNAAHKRPGMRQVVRYLEGEAPLPRHLASPDVFEDYVNSYPSVDEGDDGEGANSATPLPISRSESGR